MVSDLYGRMRASALAGKITRYAIGSVIALATSIVVFALMYVAIGNTTICSICAFVAGAIPNWILNRRWAWRIRGEVAFLREIVAYVAISLDRARRVLARHRVDQQPGAGHPARSRHPRDAS